MPRRCGCSADEHGTDQLFVGWLLSINLKKVTQVQLFGPGPLLDAEGSLLTAGAIASGKSLQRVTASD